MGWLLELDLPGADTSLLPDRVADVLRDMRLLGLQTTLLEPHGPADGETNGADAALVAESATGS
jgi:hypothetical protein